LINDNNTIVYKRFLLKQSEWEVDGFKVAVFILVIIALIALFVTVVFMWDDDEYDWYY
jgi:hypothetical protein